MAKVKDRYAGALFKISEEKNMLKEDLEQVVFIKSCLKGEDVQKFLQHPNISNKEKYNLFDEVFSGKANDYIIGMLKLMVRRNRESQILPALTQYIELVNRYFGKIGARVVSDQALLPSQIERIKNVLSKKTGMEVTVQAQIDPDIIGGFYVLVDGRIFDNTIRSQLNNMKTRFYKGRVVARFVSAEPLKGNQLQSIKDILSRKLGTEVSINAVVDKDLIGGFYVVVDGHVYDKTVRSTLKDMKNNLKRGKFEW